MDTHDKRKEILFFYPKVLWAFLQDCWGPKDSGLEATSHRPRSPSTVAAGAAGQR